MSMNVMRTAREIGMGGRGMDLGGKKRMLSVLGGTVLALYGLRRIRLSGVLLTGLGGALIYRGITGKARLSRAFGIGRPTTMTGETRGSRGVKIEREVTVHAPADTLYRIWRNFENLPRFMSHLERVRTLNDRRSRWT